MSDAGVSLEKREKKSARVQESPSETQQLQKPLQSDSFEGLDLFK